MQTIHHSDTSYEHRTCRRHSHWYYLVLRAGVSTEVYLYSAHQRLMGALHMWTGPERLLIALHAAQVGRHMLLCQR